MLEAAALPPQTGERPGGRLRQPPDDPARRAVTIEPGDSLARISARHAVNVRALAETNGLAPPYTLRPGQVLYLPPPNVHVVREGETLVSIARRYSIDTRSLAVMNRLSRPWYVWPGDELQLPPLARDQMAAGMSASPIQSAPAGGEAPPAGPVTFVWPVDGMVSRAFGPDSGGQLNEGVHIAASPGSSVIAAAEGEVAYAGGDVPGLGEIVLVQHRGGWMSAYGRADRLLVRPGDRVAQGQMIAVAGDAAGGSRDVYFQLRKDGRPVDPTAHLPPR
jgi:murein DD-endopeptidase MepM/ murein hydrolase activator NlpD